ncbi:thioredoxin reductase [Streptomyces griseus]|uniref:Thioredoxin reductase n=1 Tax=Streptomyces griseus TaxID=1911 RepID=A0A380N745_STRGR|nr:thioredoxin reductase [Streptomyces griseus]
MREIREVVIIGSGPAGCTAALYTARAQLRPLLFGSSIFVGGSLTTTTEVENFPGFPEGVDGPVLMENMRAQAEKFGAEMIDDDIVEVDLTGDIKFLTDSSGTVHRAKAVIIATGSGYRKLGLPNEDELSGRGVSWCATCDGLFFRDRDIVVVAAATPPWRKLPSSPASPAPSP